MTEQVLMSEIEIIIDGGRLRRWIAAKKLRIFEKTLEDNASISIFARHLEDCIRELEQHFGRKTLRV